jgi:hypothetical protein
MPVLRWAVLGVLLFVFVFGLMLLLRSMIGVIGTVRDDAEYPLVNMNRVIAGPILVDVALNEPRGLHGEVQANARALLVVAVAQRPDGQTYSVVNAASPLDGSRLQLERDRLVAPDGRAWTLDGAPLDPDDPPLQVFPTRLRDDAIIVDFTEPMSQ